MAERPMAAVPQCWLCRHFVDTSDPHACFPEEIPIEIYLNQYDHRTRYGDEGLCFEAVDERGADYVAHIFAHEKEIVEILRTDAPSA